MAIIYWWLIPVWVLILGAIWWFFVRKKKTSAKRRSDTTPIAHSERITRLPAYRKAYDRYRRWLLLGIIIVGVGGLLAVLLTTRPVSQDLVAPQQRNRDIMLCMDVSGSMIQVDQEIFATFKQLVDGFQGQRIGLVTFNGTAVTILPLTDDYELIDEYMNNGEEAFKLLKDQQDGRQLSNNEFDKVYAFTNGTGADSARGTSVIGDGLASCADRMGTNEARRPQSIIFASDNELAGTSIYSIPEAAKYAKDKNIRVYTLDPGMTEESYGSDEASHEELKRATISTGGLYSLTTDASVPEIISSITAQEASLYTAPLELVRRDTPTIPVIIITGILLLLIAAAWRLRL